LQNLPLESSCVIIALIENYSTSKPLKVSPEKSRILSRDTVVANERYGTSQGMKIKQADKQVTFTCSNCRNLNNLK